MSIEAMSHVLSVKVGDSTGKLVLLAYANHARKDGAAAWPGKAAVADYAECDPKTVQRHLRKLEAAGHLRRGDQDLVSHLRADRRPTVYDVAMSEAVRVAWAGEYAARAAGGQPEEPIWVYDATTDTFTEPATERGDSLPPRDSKGPVDDSAPRVDIVHPRPDGHGGTSETSRGDTAVSPNPSGTVQIPPSPAADAAGVTGDAANQTDTTPVDTTAVTSGCKAHPNGALGCRYCGTSPRQLAGAAKRAAAERERAEQRRLQQLHRDRENALRADPAKARESLAAARAAADRARDDRRAKEAG